MTAMRALELSRELQMFGQKEIFDFAARLQRHGPVSDSVIEEALRVCARTNTTLDEFLSRTKLGFIEAMMVRLGRGEQ